MEIPVRVALRAVSSFVLNERGCHISLYSTASHGYAQIGWQQGGKGYGTTAHRAAWTSVHGQIPAGMTIDHLCKERRCVQVDHLRLLSNYENGRRTSGRDWPLGVCIHGHLNSESYREPNGRRRCRPCTRLREAKRRKAKRELALALTPHKT